ncbi:hypothetical protein O3M35_004600 [Rhynocoris fuscipes]|uniref:WASH complex subunit FAM21 n=1 Tax=Rhynocoris fuscipes TaxID=488301 RepID=A0AAW1CI39_9HEMI
MENNSDKLKINFDYNPGSKWNLSNDVELLKNLEKFSENVINKATKIQKCMDELEENVISAYLQVKNISNEFQAIGDRKFIENLTRDEDETENSLETFRNIEFQDKDNTFSSNKKLEESLSNCLRIIEDKFETIQLSESDSDDDGLEHSQVVLKPRKCYIDRPLPHIIGSYEFLNDPTLGLATYLPEQDDAIETEDEGCNLSPRNYQSIMHTTEQSSESISLSRKSLDESISSYEVVANDEPPEPENRLWKNNIPFVSETTSNYDQESISQSNDIVDNVTVTTKKSSTIVNTETITNIEANISSFEKTISDDNDDFDKPFSKQIMKNMLEKIYSNPRQEFHSKNKPDDNEEKMEVEESKEDINEPIKSNFDEIMNTDDFEPLIVKKLSKINSKTDDILPEVTTESLHSLTKDRAKIPKKRRLPSRRNLNNSNKISNSNNLATSDAFNDSYNPKRSSKSTDSVFNTDFDSNSEPLSVEKNVNNNLISPATDEEDLFTVISNVNTSNETSERLFQPLKFPSKSNNIKENFPKTNDEKPKEIFEKPKSSIWDPFADDDDDDNSSLFQSNNTWSAPKFSKRSDKSLGGLVKIPSDDNLFTSNKDSTSKSFFDDIPTTTTANDKKIKSIFDDIKTNNKAETSKTSLFDDIDIDEDTLFSSNFTSKKEDSKPLTNSQSTKSKNVFLSDPLAFGNDSETE